MNDDRFKVVRDGIVDSIAILVLGTLVFTGKMAGETGAYAIVVLAGGVVLARALQSLLGSRLSTRPVSIPPSVSAALALAAPAWLALRMTLLASLVLVACAGCGASSQSRPTIACQALRAAQVAAAYAEPYVCAPPAADAGVAP